MDTISVGASDFSVFVGQVKELASNPIFMLTTFGLCSIYFVVTTIQFWLTAYMVKVLDADPDVVAVGYAFCSISGPVAGALIGGYLADKNGGYKGKNAISALNLCIAFGILAFVFCFPIGVVRNPFYIFPLLFWMLFFGAAMIPAATGLIVNSVKKENQAASSSFEQLIINLFGYFAAPLVTAYVMEQYKDEMEGMVWGFRVGLWISVFAIFFFFGALIAAKRRYGQFEKFEDDTEEPDVLTVGELKQEMVRRRMHSYSF